MKDIVFRFEFCMLHETFRDPLKYIYKILPKSVNFFKKEEIFYIQISKQNNGVVLIFSVDDTACESIHHRFSILWMSSFYK